MEKKVIYIILILLWVVYKIYKNSNAKKTVQTPPKPELHPQAEEQISNEQPTVKSLFDELLKDYQIQPVSSTIIEKKAEAVKSKHSLSSKKIKENTFTNSSMPGDSSIPSIKQQALVYSSETEMNPDYISGFDLKKAFIYSEILNNPYLHN